MRSGKKRFVYFLKPVGMERPIKIGCSNSPQNRLAHLAAWSPFPLEFIGFVDGGPADELFMHKCFADLHHHHEWFRYTPELRAAIDEVVDTGSVSVLRGKLDPAGTIRTPQQRRWTPDQKLRASYARRWRNMTWGGVPYRASDFPEIDRIMARWTHGPRHLTVTPTESEFAILDEFLKNPDAYKTTPRELLAEPKAEGAAA